MTITRVLWACSLLLAADPAFAQVRVGSKIDAEGALLGSLILETLEARGIPTEDKRRLGPTPIVRGALLAGAIDLYPDYTGNGAIFFAQRDDPAWRDAEAGYRKVSDLDRRQNGLIWLRPAPANNRWVIAVRRDLAVRAHLATMADFAAWVRGGGRVKLAASAEFVESPAALPAFEAAYGFHLIPSQLLVLAGGDTATMARAAAEGISGVDAAMAYGTDGALAALDLTVLSDPYASQVVYAPAPVVRAQALAAHPEIRAALEPVFATLDEATLRRLNKRIAVDGEDAAAVARAYLAGTPDPATANPATPGPRAWSRLPLLAQAFFRHLLISALSVLPAAALGLPLGLLAHRRPRAGALVLGTLGIIQTIPSLALFGLLIGITGIGLPSAVVALTLYALLPIVRNTAEGLSAVSPAVLEAARGLGMERGEILWRAELPLALPAIRSGLSIATVQVIGLAVVAALIGAGGLGALLFQGIYADSLGLVLMGALPAALLATLVP